MKKADDKFLKELDMRADALRKSILLAESEYPRNAVKYYVSNDGDDSNDGLSPEKPIRTFKRLKEIDVRPGEVVLLRRGDLFREQLVTKTCVTYSAYGEGEKPTIYGTGGSACDPSDWEQTDTENVWVLKRPVENDVGNIMFEGKIPSRKRFAPLEIKNDDGTVRKTRPDGVGKYEGLSDLNENLQFHHDKNDNHVYLRCDGGNPAECFSSVEIVSRGNGIALTSGVKSTIFALNMQVLTASEGRRALMLQSATVK